MAKATSKKETKKNYLPWLANNPDPILWFLLAILFFFLSALSFYARPNQVKQLTDQAQTYFNKGDFQTSFNLLNRAALLDDTNPNIHYQLSAIYQATNNWQDAQKELFLALEFSPNSKVINNNLTIVKQTINEPGKIQAEINFWEKEMQSKPDYRDAYLQLAVRYYQLYQIDKAKQNLQKAFGLDPNFEVTKKLMEIIK